MDFKKSFEVMMWGGSEALLAIAIVSTDGALMFRFGSLRIR